MADDPLQEVLRPARDAELGGPGWKRFALRAPEERATGERPVDDDVHLALGGEREDAIFRLALAERVIDLQEVVGAVLEPALDLGVRGRGVVRDADVAHAALLLPLLQGLGV